MCGFVILPAMDDSDFELGLDPDELDDDLEDPELDDEGPGD